MRILESREVEFTIMEYDVKESDLSALAVASKTGQDIDRIFKTLVLRSNTDVILVCVIPGACELDLKKAAKAAGFKKVDLIPVKEIQSLTGYLRGGCSPVGMKKQYPTFIDETCMLHNSIFVSAGVRGRQVQLSPEDLIDTVHAEVADLV